MEYCFVEDGLPRMNEVSPSLQMLNGSPYLTSFINIGGLSKGLALQIDGSSVGALLSAGAEVSKCELRRYASELKEMTDVNTTTQITQTAPLKIIRDGGHVFIRAEYPDFEIPKGLIISPNAPYGKRLSLLKYSYTLLFKFSIKLIHRLELEDNVLRITCVPLANPAAGSISHMAKFYFDESDYFDRETGTFLD